MVRKWLLPTAHSYKYLFSAARGREEAACLCCEFEFRENQQSTETLSLYQIKEEVIKNDLLQRYVQTTELFFVYPKCDNKKKIKVRIYTNP